MRLIANRPCTFGGYKFLTGNEIPVELVANPKMQEKMGTLSIADDGDLSNFPTLLPVGQTDEVKFEVIIYSENGDITLGLTNDELSVFTDILQIGVNKTEDKQKISDLIQNVESEDLLIALDALDGRKFVKDEVQNRVATLSPSGNSDEESSEGGDE